MDLNLKGKRALVCGGSNGIGLASAVELAALGAEVTLLSRSEEKLKKAIACLAGNHHHYLCCDISEHEKLKELISQEIEKKTFSILINNTAGPAAGAISKARPEQFLEAFKAHLLSAHVISQLLLPGMKELGFGRIVNVTSTSVKSPLPNLGVSNTIRAAVANWSKTLATEVAPYGITVNLVLPGATETDRLQEIFQNRAKTSGRDLQDIISEYQEEIPMKRFARPEEIANAVAFLCSPAASYITGIALAADGGRTPNL